MVYLDVCKGLNHIGRLGEHEHRTLRFWDSANILAMYPEATVTVLHKRPGDAQAYPVAPGYVEIQDGIVLWTIQSGDLARVGKGQVELVFHNGNTIAKSIIFDTFIDRALDCAGDPPEPWESWIDEVTDAADRAEDAAELLENPGATAETLSAGSEATASYSDGTFHFGIPRGQQGGKGDPGDDYVITEEDYDEIAEAVVESQGLQRIVDDATDSANIAHKLVDGKDLNGDPDPQYSENNAEHYRQLAAQSAEDADGSKVAIQNMTVSSQALTPGSTPTVTKTVDQQTGAVNLEYGLSAGVTYTPSVSGAGVLSFTNDGNKQNPQAVDIAGAVRGVFDIAVTGTTPTINGADNCRYTCGEVSTITIVPPASGQIIVVFESGSTAAVLTASGVVWPEWFDSTDLETDVVYEMSIANGRGAVMSWPTT